MAGKSSAETRMTLYRIVGMTSLRDALRDKYLELDTFECRSITVGGRPSFLVVGKTEEKDARWSSILAGLSGETISLKNSSAAAVLLIQDTEKARLDNEGVQETPPDEQDNKNNAEDTAWALTFGMGFQLLEQKYVDHGFGQKIAIRAANPAGLNSISKTTLDERPRIERSTIASGGPLRSFGFEDLGDLATRLVTEGEIAGIGQNGKPVKIKGADSLSLPLSKDPNQFLSDLEKIKTTLNLKPSSDELAALEQLALVKDEGRLDELDKALLEAINQENSALLTISFPHELIDEYGDAGAYKLRGTGQRSARDYLPTLEALLAPIRKAPTSSRKQKLDGLSVQLFRESDDNNPISPKINVKKWFAFQTEIEGQRYYLHNGKWFSMNRDYASFVRRRTREIFNRGSPIGELPDWSIVDIADKDQQKVENAELRYNRILAEHLEGLCLDQKLVRSELHRHGIEACDVLLKDGTFIHVKHIDSSAPASHLLAQALVSTEVLTYDKQAQENLKKHIAAVGGNPDEYKSRPSRVVIVMAKKSLRLGPNDLFTFTQVNLARQVAQLEQQQVPVHIASIARTVQG